MRPKFSSLTQFGGMIGALAVCCLFNTKRCVALPNQPTPVGRVPDKNDFSLPSHYLETARKDEDLDDPLFTSRIDYPPANLIQSDPTARLKYQEQFQESWRWWSLILSKDFLPSDITVGAVPGGPNQDDLIVSRFKARYGSLQIIDGRSLTIIVELDDPSLYQMPVFGEREPLSNSGRLPRRKTPQVQNSENTRPEELTDKERITAPASPIPNQEKIENFVHAVFRVALRFDANEESDLLKTRVETRKYSPVDGSYGVLSVDRHAVGWILNGAITWWSDGRTIVFDIRKVIEPPDDKISVPGREYAFGLPFSDKQKFTRFPTSDIDFRKVMANAVDDPRITKYYPDWKKKPETSGMPEGRIEMRVR